MSDLGAGALACYAKDQQNWTLYEIDPLVVDIASNPAYFSYLSQCAHNATMRVGDARLSLEKEPDQHFDLLVMDAFSSDSVPTHLLTKEALELYFKKLKPNGILAFHMTNRHLSLKKVLSIHAEALAFGCTDSGIQTAAGNPAGRCDRLGGHGKACRNTGTAAPKPSRQLAKNAFILRHEALDR